MLSFDRMPVIQDLIRVEHYSTFVTVKLQNQARSKYRTVVYQTQDRRSGDRTNV